MIFSIDDTLLIPTFLVTHFIIRYTIQQLPDGISISDKFIIMLLTVYLQSKS